MSSKLGLVTRLVRQNTRRFTTSESKCAYEETVEKLHKRQAEFQRKTEPIHLKAGKTHFYITCAFGVVLIGITSKNLYRFIAHN